MTTSDVIISVVIPAYNYGKTLPRAAESVLRQLGDYAELIIIDDGSTDDTPVVMAGLEQAYPGQLRGISQANAGLAAVRNRGIDEACGAYLVFLDADDEMVDGALALLFRHIAENPNSRLIIGGHISVYGDGRRYEHAPDPLPAGAFARVKGYLLEKTLGVSNGACAMHREVFALGRYPERFRNAEDIPVFAQVFATYPCTLLHSPLALIYKHEDSLRHNLSYGMQIGEQLVGEIFETGRLPAAMHTLKKPFAAQRYLSLFRTFATAGEAQKAREFYRQALSADWRAVLRWSYTRKAIKLWVRGH